MSLIWQPVAYDSSMRTVYAEHIITGASKPDKTFPVTRCAGLAQASPVECVATGDTTRRSGTGQNGAGRSSSLFHVGSLRTMRESITSRARSARDSALDASDPATPECGTCGCGRVGAC